MMARATPSWRAETALIFKSAQDRRELLQRNESYVTKWLRKEDKKMTVAAVKS